MKGQVAVEYLVLFGAFLMIFGIVIWPQAISPSQKVAMETSSMSRAKILADSLADAINSVYSAGPGSCRTFLFTLEQGCMVSLENQITENGALKVVRVESGENFIAPIRYLSENLNGTYLYLPPGTHAARVLWENAQENLWYENRTLYVRIRPG
jgi:uncharacterized protein (UPF0333 family)